MSNKPKETAVVISFPNHEYIICSNDLRHTQINNDKKKLAYFIQNQLCKMYDILGKKYYESTSFKLHWTNITTWLPCIYPQFVFELTHNLPGKDFLENGSLFNAKFELAIYDKTLYGKFGVCNENALLYKIKIEIRGIKKEHGIEVVNSNYHHLKYKYLSIIMPQEYIDKTEVWLNKSSSTEYKNTILCDFVKSIIEIIKENN